MLVGLHYESIPRVTHQILSRHLLEGINMSLNVLDEALLRNDIMSKLSRILDRLEQIDTRFAKAYASTIKRLDIHSDMLSELHREIQELEDKK